MPIPRNRTGTMSTRAKAGLAGLLIAALGLGLVTPLASASPATAASTGDVPLTVTQKTDAAAGIQTTVSWTWTGADPSGGWKVSRDGTDTGGTGAWSTVLPGDARTHTFNYLREGDTYELSVEPVLKPGLVSVIATGSEQAAALTATATQTGTGTVVLRWTGSKDAEAWTVSRNGKDTSGYGPWATTLKQPGLREWTFNHLREGDTYVFTVKAASGASASAKVTITNAEPSPSPSGTAAPSPQPTTSPVPTPQPPLPATGDWLSGVATVEQGNTNPAKAFGDWRGTAIEIGQTWPNTLDMWGVNPAVANGWANFTGPMSISIAPGVDAHGKTIDQNGHKGWRGWKALANGDNDSWWRAAAQNLKKLRAGKGTTYVSPMYEFNGEWMAWSVNGDIASFKAGWERMAKIWKQEYPESVLVLPIACNRGWDSKDFPAAWSYDMVGCTIYNAWPWEENGKTTIASLEKARQQAKAFGKPIGITEWANSANGKTPGGGGDAAGFMKAMNDWMKANAGGGSGQLVFETFFNIDGYALDHRILPTTTQPKAAAEYQRLW